MLLVQNRIISRHYHNMILYNIILLYYSILMVLLANSMRPNLALWRRVSEWVCFEWFRFFFWTPSFWVSCPHPPSTPCPPQWGGWVGTVEADICGQLGVIICPGMAMGVWQSGSGTGGLQTCEACLYMGLASPRWGGGEVGSTPTPCVDAGTLHQNRTPFILT